MYVLKYCHGMHVTQTDICSGKLQHALRSAGCTATNVANYCESGPAPKWNSSDGLAGIVVGTKVGTGYQNDPSKAGARFAVRF
jgi:hypothetical protein